MDFKKIIASDRTVLIICIAVAAIIWFFSELGKQVSYTITTSLKVETPLGYSFLSSPEENVSFTLRGSGWQLWRFLQKNELDTFSINLFPKSGTQVIGNDEIKNQFRKRYEADKIKIERINPGSIILQLDQTSKKCIPLKVPLKLSFEKFYSNTQEIKLSKDSVCIFGSASTLANYKNWISDTLELSQLSESKEGIIKLTGNKQLQIEPDIINYALPVEKFTSHQLILPIQTPSITNKNMILLPSQAEIEFNLPLSRFDQYNFKDSLKAYIRLEDTLEFENKLPVRLKVPEVQWIKNLDYTPKEVEYYYQE